ncbi:unnamed protein product [Bradyrhizobium oligotrophicum S58]|uniref:Unnamed protein product n=1 Tax=Bradyrhizobium oligotrophicum S58 TaxID=1245469 RepID=M4Z7A4_9BRAD|nr:DUF4265 domain-containing protein [Bradyrhizobium oligotrophicum]BAM88971.1 unnamed protein product [Bradyrhizobium oligotrophicum S58]
MDIRPGGLSLIENLIKIRFELDVSDWHGHGSETLWAEPVRERGPDVFRIRSSPFFTRGINHLDIVKSLPTDRRELYVFSSVIERGGHSTYMLLFEPGDERVAFHWKMIEDIGCSFESMMIRVSMGPRTLYAVDVPGNADLAEVYRLLAQGESMGLWMFQEGHANAR